MPANLTEFRDNTGVDVSDKFVSVNELEQIDPYLNFAGQDLYYTPGALWGWGSGDKYQLGMGTTSSNTPIQVGTDTTWKLIACGTYQSTAIKTNGTLWTWGNNDNEYGLGVGDMLHRTSPVQIGSDINWKTLSAGYYTKGAIKSDGSLWTWGRNASGTLGLNGLAVSVPTQVGSLTDWRQISVGFDHMAAIRSNGTLWTWGSNYRGGLGLGNTTNQSSPVQVGTLTNWKYVSAMQRHTLAIKTDGTLWSWGNNSYGILGLGDITHRSSPVQVGSLTNWKTLPTGNGFIGAAIKTDGTLWTWGANIFYGVLGLGDTNSVSSPVQVGSLTNWKNISTGSEFVIANKTDGTLWTWGRNKSARGITDTQHVSSPVQIGSLTNWKYVSAAYNHSLAIK